MNKILNIIRWIIVLLFASMFVMIFVVYINTLMYVIFNFQGSQLNMVISFMVLFLIVIMFVICFGGIVLKNTFFRKEDENE